MIVNYGRMGTYLRAGNPIACRYCVHLGEQLGDELGTARCLEKLQLTRLDGHCTSFWREVGTDDA